MLDQQRQEAPLGVLVTVGQVAARLERPKGQGVEAQREPPWAQ